MSSFCSGGQPARGADEGARRRTSSDSGCSGIIFSHLSSVRVSHRCNLGSSFGPLLQWPPWIVGSSSARLARTARVGAAYGPRRGKGLRVDVAGEVSCGHDDVVSARLGQCQGASAPDDACAGDGQPSRPLRYRGLRSLPAPMTRTRGRRLAAMRRRLSRVVEWQNGTRFFLGHGAAARRVGGARRGMSKRSKMYSETADSRSGKDTGKRTGRREGHEREKTSSLGGSSGAVLNLAEEVLLRHEPVLGRLVRLALRFVPREVVAVDDGGQELGHLEQGQVLADARPAALAELGGSASSAGARRDRDEEEGHGP